MTTFAGLFGFLAFLAVALTALIIFLVYGKRGGWTRQESKEALNFQITYLIINIGWGILAMIIGAAMAGTILSSGGFGALMTWVWIAGLIGFAFYAVNAWFSWLGFNAVKKGGAYRYPINFRFIK